jgi:hypothetical protein
LLKKFNRWLHDRRYRKLALEVRKMFAAHDICAYRTASPGEQRRAREAAGRLAPKANALSSKLGVPIENFRVV